MSRPVLLTQLEARRIWLSAQRLTERAPFGSGVAGVVETIAHLGYVQIDTISVVERAHHHILFTRLPDYRRADLAQAQSVDKAVFEYWTHALAYIPTADLRYFLPEMKRHEQAPSQWFTQVADKDYRRVLRTIRADGAISIRDIEDEELREKTHPWASRKPSKAALQLGFYNGRLAIAERQGMVKTYELMERHFGWEKRPKPATERQVTEYLLERALRAQGVVSLDSICHLNARQKPAMRELIERRVKARRLKPVSIEGVKDAHWAAPEVLAAIPAETPPLVHVLSPFDPLIIQRKRTNLLFGYDHIFEAYVPKDKRRFGYFTLPVLVGEDIVAVLDLKTDRAAGRLLIQAWHWVGQGSPERHGAAIEAELVRFERFQLGVD